MCYSPKDPPSSRPAYEKLHSQNALDPGSFETKPLPRSRKGFQPPSQASRGQEQSAVSSVTIEMPSSTSPQKVPDGKADTQPRRVDEPATTAKGSKLDHPSEISGSTATVQANQVAPSLEGTNQAAGQIQVGGNSVADSKSNVGSASI